MATTFQSPFDGLPEPLITIWEPQSYEALLSYLANGYTCPRKVLIKSNNAHILQPPDADALMNVNTPEDFAKAEQLINQRKEWQNAARYTCQLNLPGFGTESQHKLQHAKVLLVGAGGLGCPAAQYLTATGVGTLAIADFDTISTGNLHRQLLYTPAEVGLLKAQVACKKLQQQNPQITLLPITDKITSTNIMALIKQYDIVVDCTDNFETKYLLNDACVLSAKPLVYAAIYQYEGQLSVLNTLNNNGTRSPNYRDIFPDVNAAEIPSCAEGGVLPTIAGIIGSMQANEVIKYITRVGELLTGKLLILDALTLQSRIIKTGHATKTTITALLQTETISLISVNDLRNGITNGLFELIDVRNMEERNQYHIGGKHIPLAEIETSISLIDGNKPIVFYCRSGRRSAEAIRLIKKHFAGSKLLSLKGGLKAWKEKQFPATIPHSQAE
jgi:adenylyltransferase/sulfurtransferase